MDDPKNLATSDEPIVALSTPAGTGALGIIRVSGHGSIELVGQHFRGKDLREQNSHTMTHGTILFEEKFIDEVVIGLFRAPRSYTSEDLVEIYCHSSPYIISTILDLLVSSGGRLADPGEFTLRSYLHGKMDLSQAEAVSDLIQSETSAAHRIAAQQLKGGIKKQLNHLREQLMEFASRLELEIDFSEEEVEFASREDLLKLVGQVMAVVSELIQSYELGNAIKHGIPTVIIGKPNAGKSTLLNRLVGEDAALVTDIPGTTRDLVERVMNVEGVKFRFIDTAGLRETDDKVESMGILRTREAINSSRLVLLVVDLSRGTRKDVETEIDQMGLSEQRIIVVGNKVDRSIAPVRDFVHSLPNGVCISSLYGEGMSGLMSLVRKTLGIDRADQGQVLISSARHLSCLKNAEIDLRRSMDGLKGKLNSDLIALDVQNAISHLGEITGVISSDDLLRNIFSKFCIGK